jgi:2-polyprenyl-3-methyl-5-hydroxy-6-metoxy-1,4-benzoquinol methylase
VNGYHEFVFDECKREFRGKFEEMYQAELIEQFDSWGQDDDRRLDLRITKMLVDSLDPKKIVDIGSGKGLLTSFLDAPDRNVIGCDVSGTALSIARVRDPHVAYTQLPDASVYSLVQFLFRSRQELGHIDVVVMSQVLSYINEWKNLIDIVFAYSAGVCVSLYLPENPIGFVKDWSEVCEVIERHSTIKASLWDSANRTGYLLATQ